MSASQTTHNRPQNRGRISRQRRIILLALALAALIATLLLLSQHLFGAQPGSGVAAGQMPRLFQQQSAHQAYEVAVEWANAWQADAGLVSCIGTQTRGAETSQGWTMQLYSAEASRIALVRVSGNQVSVLRETAALYPQTSLDREIWQVDSKSLLREWWRSGGADVWHRPGTDNLNLKLGRNADDILTWQVTVTNKNGSALDFWEFDATEGELMTRMPGSSEQ